MLRSQFVSLRAFASSHQITQCSCAASGTQTAGRPLRPGKRAVFFRSKKHNILSLSRKRDALPQGAHPQLISAVSC